MKPEPGELRIDQRFDEPAARLEAPHQQVGRRDGGEQCRDESHARVGKDLFAELEAEKDEGQREGKRHQLEGVVRYAEDREQGGDDVTFEVTQVRLAGIENGALAAYDVQRWQADSRFVALDQPLGGG